VTGLPDAGTLDALVIGASDPDDGAAWDALVKLPGGAEAWADAVARRRRMDILAGVVCGRPWLASCMLRLSTLARRIRTRTAVELLLEFPDAPLDALAGATLGPVDESFADRAIRPRWGQIVPVGVRIGERVALRVVPDPPFVDVRYLSEGTNGSLPSRTWRLEPGEAPVLIVALLGTAAGSSLSDALEHATATAGVLLLEATPAGTTAI